MITEQNLGRFDTTCLTWRHPHFSHEQLARPRCTAYSKPKSWHTDEQWGHKRQGENRFAPDEGHVISAAFSAAFSNNFWAASKAAFNHAANMILR